jgi:hypothetical protein
MATPFAAFPNLRIVWTPLGAITDLREGVQEAGTPILIEAFAKGVGRTEELTGGIRAGALVLDGYVTRYATMGAGQSITTAASAFSWTGTGLRPPGLLPGAIGEAFFGNVQGLPTVTPGAERGKVRFTVFSADFGVGGIGALVRPLTGDKFKALLGTVA